jgi:eukaryotic-like serine/threonine-protein kinase
MAMVASDRLLADRYLIIRALGEGGMGRVYEVENRLTGRRAAVKQLHIGERSHEEDVRRVVREARAMARVRHRNVVDVYDVLVEPDGVYLVMELLRGETLATRMARAPLPMAELLDHLCGAMRGVAAAHEAGVVHRDIKPENIFLATYPDELLPVPVVLDFGISKLTGESADARTASGVTMGTPRYVSFEQLCGARDVDGRTDVYAFGVILYEALTGAAPYPANSFAEQAIAFIMHAPAPLTLLRPDLAPELAALLERAIAREPGERMDSLRALSAALAPYGAQGARPLAGDMRTAAEPRRSRDPRGLSTVPHALDAAVDAQGSVLTPSEAPRPSRLPTAPRSSAHPDGLRPARRQRVARVLALGVAVLAAYGWWRAHRASVLPDGPAVAVPEGPAAADTSAVSLPRPTTAPGAEEMPTLGRPDAVAAPGPAAVRAGPEESALESARSAASSPAREAPAPTLQRNTVPALSVPRRRPLGEPVGSVAAPRPASAEPPTPGPAYAPAGEVDDSPEHRAGPIRRGDFE